MCIHARRSIPIDGSFFRVFTNQLIVINKHGEISSEVEHSKFITVTCTQMKQVNKVSFLYDSTQKK